MNNAESDHFLESFDDLSEDFICHLLIDFASGAVTF